MQRCQSVLQNAAQGGGCQCLAVGERAGCRPGDHSICLVDGYIPGSVDVEEIHVAAISSSKGVCTCSNWLYVPKAVPEMLTASPM